MVLFGNRDDLGVVPGIGVCVRRQDVVVRLLVVCILLCAMVDAGVAGEWNKKAVESLS
jgi:hypothetical protein